MIASLTVKVRFEIVKESEDSFLVTCPQIGCIFVQEETEESAIRAAQHAVEAYIAMSLKHGDAIPPEIVLQQETKVFGKQHDSSSPETLDVIRDIAVAI